MPRKALLVVPLALVAGVCLYLGFSAPPGGGFAVPESFPVLEPAEVGPADPAPAGGTELATFGSGCFWCSDAVFRPLKGVRSVECGYSGGTVPFPSYERVCTGTTGHAEVIQVAFDPTAVSYPELLEVFWRSHDPTTRNRQGNDVGPQYRSAVFTHSARQQELAERYKAKIDEAGVFRSPVVTEIEPLAAFYPAGAEHQNYFAANPRAGYCRAVIGPKVEKLRKVFGGRLNPE